MKRKLKQVIKYYSKIVNYNKQTFGSAFEYNLPNINENNFEYNIENVSIENHYNNNTNNNQIYLVCGKNLYKYNITDPKNASILRMDNINTTNNTNNSNITSCLRPAFTRK